MNRQWILAGALIAATVPAKAQVVLDLSQITCGQYLAAGEDDKLFISAWLGGYFSAAANRPAIDVRYLRRNHEVIGKYCERNKGTTLMSAVAKKAE
jgi:acid stress chaperone HdeB